MIFSLLLDVETLQLKKKYIYFNKTSLPKPFYHVVLHFIYNRIQVIFNDSSSETFWAFQMSQVWISWARISKK
jgi:hypothetical protein